MSFFKKNLEELSEADLLRLEKEEIPESIRLEFKRELNLEDRKEKAEAAKDVSAMANTAGGCILYGLDERQLPDGSTVAGPVCPLSDGTLDSRLEDVLLSSIFPQPRFRTRKIDVTGGFVLVVEVYPAYSGNLYMVTGFKENRFYRRGEQRTVLMTEPEIREAYARIAASRQALERSIEDAIASETAMVPHLHESVIVVPWYGHRDLVNPRQFGRSLGLDLHNGILFDNQWREVASWMRVVGDGYRGYGPGDGPVNKCQQYMAVRRNGLVHCAGPFGNHSKNGLLLAYFTQALESIVAAMVTARHILESAGYWGPVRVIHRLRAGSPFCLLDAREIPERLRCFGHSPVDPGEYLHVLPEANLRESGTTFRPILRELMDQVFQTGGRETCPWFDASGDLTELGRSLVPPQLLKYLED